MMRLAAIGSVVFFFLVCALTGCLPASDNHVDEEKDPHYQRGRVLVGAQDPKGAAEEFEKALESNPRSAAAHSELGPLCEKDKDYSAAIYHYERYLALRKDFDRERERNIRGRITLCKRELANTEFTVPNSQNLQREVDRLTAENVTLKQRLEALTTQLNAATVTLAHVENARQTTPSATTTGGNRGAASSDGTDVPAGRPHVHVVRAGETMGMIASQYKIKLKVLQSANPSVDSRRLKIGQSLNLPSQ